MHVFGNALKCLCNGKHSISWRSFSVALLLTDFQGYRDFARDDFAPSVSLADT